MILGRASCLRLYRRGDCLRLWCRTGRTTSYGERIVQCFQPGRCLGKCRSICTWLRGRSCSTGEGWGGVGLLGPLEPLCCMLLHGWGCTSQEPEQDKRLAPVCGGNDVAVSGQQWQALPLNRVSSQQQLWQMAVVGCISATPSAVTCGGNPGHVTIIIKHWDSCSLMCWHCSKAVLCCVEGWHRGHYFNCSPERLLITTPLAAGRHLWWGCRTSRRLTL